MNFPEEFEAADQVLVINLLYLGDLVFSLPLIQELKRQCPQKELHLLALDPFINLLEGADFIDHLIPYNKRSGWQEAATAAGELRKIKYDFSLNVHGSWRSLLFQRAASTGVRIGYTRESSTFQGLFLDYARTWNPQKKHIVEYQLRWLNELGLELPENAGLPGIKPPDSARESIKKMLDDSFSSEWRGNLLVLNPGGSWPSKRWPVEKFIGLGRQVLTRLDAKIVITGGESDIKRNEEIARGILNKAENFGSDSIFQAAGKTSIPELLALMTRADAAVSGDTGPAHVAALAGTPQVTLFGPSDEKKYRPYASGNRAQILNNDVDCRPCGEHNCPLDHHRCLEEIQPEEVLNQIENILR